jgi:hypothetical protein
MGARLNQLYSACQNSSQSRLSRGYTLIRRWCLGHTLSAATMAEIAASIIGISSFSIKLTLTLYEFSSTTASARQETERIAKHLSLYSNVLELLAERLELDAPIISEGAIGLCEELYDQSEQVFKQAKALIPRKDPRDDLGFMQKITWNFKKAKVDRLVRELECLKNTANLLVTVIFTGKRIRSYQKRQTDSGDSHIAKERVALDIQCLKAQNATVEYTIATEQFDKLKQEDELAETRLIVRATVILLEAQCFSSFCPRLWSSLTFKILLLRLRLHRGCAATFYKIPLSYCMTYYCIGRLLIGFLNRQVHLTQV